MKEQYYENLDARLVRHTLKNGLEIIINPRPGFTRKLAYFATDYGSIHRKFTLDGKEMEAPQGVAHYLEHKMFDLPGRDVAAEFSAMGAVENAFTSYDMTAYYFSCTERFPDCLRLLLEFVSTPYFTEETVEKERGIIGQEIGMTDDTPDSRMFDNLMAAMYENHPVKEPILGTRETIARITPQVLYDCHRAFYRPDNMVLCVVGDVDPEEVVKIAEEVLPESLPAGEPAQRSWEENMAVLQPETTLSMEVSMPMFQLGFKCEPLGRGEEAVRQELMADLAAEALFGESSQLYLDLYQQGIIDSSFGGGFEMVEGMAMLTCSGDSDDPAAVREAIFSYGEKIIREGISKDHFERIKRSALGRRIRDLDSFSSTCFRLCAYHMSGFDYFHFPQLYQSISQSELQQFLSRVITRERCSLSVVTPKEEVNHESC